jgi:hypothetical protein
MDVFAEYMVKRKKEAKDYAIIAAIVIAGIILTVACFFVIMFLVLSKINIAGVAFVVIAAVWYGAYLLIHMRNLEYEYILTNSDLDVDKIVARRGRRHVEDVDLKEILICACTEDNAFAHEYKNTEGLSKIIDVTGDKANGGVYFIDYNADGGRRRLLFQPSKKMRDGMKKANSRCVHIFGEEV